MQAPSSVLSVQTLSKRYGPLLALDALSFELPAGAFVGLLGPNGAGKTTLFQLLTGLFAADDGAIEVQGRSMQREPWRALAHIGVVFQQGALDLDLSVERNLRFHAALHGLPRALATERIAQECAALGLTKDLARPVRELSGGNRRKVELARALLHRPALLLMDEASVGLDAASRRDLLAALRADVAARASTVLWATHLVDEVTAADRVLVLHRGRLLADGAPDAVCASLGGTTLEAGFIARTRTLKEAVPA
jgi:ABC-2 type transport system ATP-binding protein